VRFWWLYREDRPSTGRITNNLVGRDLVGRDAAGTPIFSVPRGDDPAPSGS